MAQHFQIEHVARTPAGWHVRTLRRGKHRIRVAFPSIRAASGHVIEILHPRGENPGCIVKNGLLATQKNPMAELVIMGANPIAELVVMGTNGRRGNPRRKRNPEIRWNRLTFQGRTYTYEYKTAWGKRYYSFDNQRSWHTSKKAAFKAAYPGVLKNPRGRNQFPGMAAAAEYFATDKALRAATHGVPRFKSSVSRRAESSARTRRARNPVEAAELRSEFVQRPWETYEEWSEPHVPRGNYAMLGDLLDLFVIPPWGGSAIRLSFVAKGIDVICDGAGRQIYFVDGDQNLAPQLPKFGAANSGRVLLGRCRDIYYGEAKDHNEIDPNYRGKYVQWEHRFGEVSGIMPELYYDAGMKRMLLERGNYRVEKPGIID
jgi:hypothetical protein